ncbi:inner capsid protein VP6 [Rotavirus G]|uniref:Intermediate capsid protein VP6 n=1 Tax=Rotavirus G TaxID=183407 RepID=A0A2R2XE28_9REOV|nr:inner capsid protein VP6 [Rotavirus G]ASV45200.1 inner capsid protein VP6 [Rotavirus G]
MDLVETVNAVVDLQRRIYELSSNTNLSSKGQQTVNDYNALASRLNGKTYALHDQTAVFTPYVVNMNLISISTRISTDDYDAMKEGINGLFDVIAAAIRTECSRRVRAIEQRVLEPAVKMLLEDIRLKAQASKIAIANMSAYDTAKLEPQVINIENPLRPGIVDDVLQRANFTQRGGGIRYTTGRWSGNKGIITCVSGTDGVHTVEIRLRTALTGILNLVYVPAPGKVVQSRERAQGVPVTLKCSDVSPDMSRGDLVIEFLRNGVVVDAEGGSGTFQFTQCDTIRLRIEPWDAAKNINPTPDFVNWNQNQANSQPTVSIMFEIRQAYTQLENDEMSADAPKVQHYLDTIFTQDSFVRSPNVFWRAQDMANAQNDTAWARKIITSVAAFAAKI